MPKRLHVHELQIIGLFYSTVSSAVNAMACVLVEDFIKPYSNWKDETYKWLSKSKTTRF